MAKCIFDTCSLCCITSDLMTVYMSVNVKPIASMCCNVFRIIVELEEQLPLKKSCCDNY